MSITFARRGGIIGKVEIELYNDVVPKTVFNFMELVKGRKYLGCLVHRIIPGFMAQMGDFTKGNGTGGTSIYGAKFEDENFDLYHDEPGLLSMANSGPDTNGSQFFITFVPTPHLDGKHVVFGKVISGFEDTILEIEQYGTTSGKPKEDIRIIDNGLN